MNDAKITPEEFHNRMKELNTRINRWEMMDGYDGPNNIIKKLEYAVEDSNVDLYWGEVMELLGESLGALVKKDKQIANLEAKIDDLQEAITFNMKLIENQSFHAIDLQEALEPFAMAAEDYPTDAEDDETAYLKRFSIGSLRKAHKAYYGETK